MSAPAEDSDERAAALRLTPVSRETEARLAILVGELRRWQAAKNLVASGTLDSVWVRHVADSLQLFGVRPEGRHWLDLGSGGGFPGLVIGACLAEHGGRIELVESNARKCAFLRHAARLMQIPATVHVARIEDVAARFAGVVDTVTARALAPLPVLLGWTKELLRTGAVGVFPKGQQAQAELTEATRSWKIQATILPSLTDSAARIVVVREAQLRD